MSLSRKHFESVAKIVSKTQQTECVDLTPLIYDVADYFASQNPNFDFCKFEQACNDDGGQDD